jgi:hypothetical protein
MSKYILFLVLISCGVEYKCEKSYVKEILMCSNATADAWSGRQEGECAVVLENGMKIKVPSPTYVGESVEYNCRYVATKGENYSGY